MEMEALSSSPSSVLVLQHRREEGGEKEHMKRSNDESLSCASFRSVPLVSQDREKGCRHRGEKRDAGCESREQEERRKGKNWGQIRERG